MGEEEGRIGNDGDEPSAPPTKSRARAVPALKAWVRSLAVSRGDLGRDAVAGIPGAVGSVPDGMAASVLVGVNPIHGLYASFAGPIFGGLTSSTRLMVITTTSAAALAAGSALQGFDPAARTEALILLTLLAGVRHGGRRPAPAGSLHALRLALRHAGLPHRCRRQHRPQPGERPDGSRGERRRRADARSRRRPPSRPHRPGRLCSSAERRSSCCCSSRGRGSRPTPRSSRWPCPASSRWRCRAWRPSPTSATSPRASRCRTCRRCSLLFSVPVLTGAVVIAVIVLVQGAGVAEAAPNPDGAAFGHQRRLQAQGIANIAAGLFRGQPVGGSVGQTALNAAAGARTRWASIFSGLWMLAILSVLSGFVGKVAMPTLAAILIFAAVELRQGRRDPHDGAHGRRARSSPW